MSYISVIVTSYSLDSFESIIFYNVYYLPIVSMLQSLRLLESETCRYNALKFEVNTL